MSVDDAFTLRAPGSGTATPPPRGYLVTETVYGTRVEGTGGGQLLYARPDAPADPPGEGRESGASDGAPDRVDVAIVDVVESPWTIGALRRSGIAGDTTAVIAVGGDHRLHSPDEFTRRARLWGASCPADGQELLCPPSAWPPGRVRGPRRVLVTGGARSGKSTEAELRALGEPEVTYLATGPAPAGDDSWARRVKAHRERRPWWWRTVETSDVAGTLDRASGTVLVDCVGTWLAGEMEQCGMWRDPPPPGAEEALSSRVDEVVRAWRRTSAHVVAVTNEVGSGVVPPTVSGGLFRDHLGWLNQLLAAESEDVVLVTAGRVVELP
ncbi:bifunctional adenosylcobinamide kinase/adenosylcobinamide-phosphate guanylyltransferase [Halostreptopolyspora alba]|uniref:Adenosylcobinamide kinase n=1 Tax=Halostreptopolyspora alba TaxID=2487137 RepID=A0A3N0E1V9_9ACTN|nr:bifunctional adenosylcobinamide kinase/adenosylcobinamide-phosphate guanylyltransferase [Nocardiopsaceae bacterium YIM 96095]